MGITNSFAGCIYVIQQKAMGQYLLPLYLFLYDRFIAGMVLSPTTIQHSFTSYSWDHFNQKFFLKQKKVSGGKDSSISNQKNILPHHWQR